MANIEYDENILILPRRLKGRTRTATFILSEAISKKNLKFCLDELLSMTMGRCIGNVELDVSSYSSHH